MCWRSSDTAQAGPLDLLRRGMLDFGPLGAWFVVQVGTDFAGEDVFFVSTQISFTAAPATAFSSFGVPFALLFREVDGTREVAVVIR